MNAQDLKQRLNACLSDQGVADFQRDGAVCIRQLLTPDEVALLREGVDANLAAPSPRDKVTSRPDDQSRTQFDRLVRETPQFPGLANILPAGAYMDHLLFPLLVG